MSETATHDVETAIVVDPYFASDGDEGTRPPPRSVNPDTRSTNLTISDDNCGTTNNNNNAGSSSSTPSSSSGVPVGVVWPQTFERSIMLLASPILPKADAVRYTKSPAPGGQWQNQHQRRNNDLDRGIYTPTMTMYGSALEHRNQHPYGGTVDRLLLIRRPSLDLSMKNHHHQDCDDVLGLGFDHMNQQHQKNQTDEAKLYRQRLLMTKNSYQQQQQQQQQPQHKSKEKKKTKKYSDGDSTGGMETNGDGKASVLQCVFNLSNILMGVGLLGLPYVFRLTGYLGGTLCILVLATICWRTAILIGRCLKGDYYAATPNHHKSNLRQLRPPLHSFPDIAKASFGETGCYILSTILYFELFSCISIFFVSIGDHLHQLIPSVSATVHMTIVSGISMIPTILLRTPALLSYLSMVGTIATIAVVVSVVSAGVLEGDNVGVDVVVSNQNIDGAVAAVPLSYNAPYHCVWDGQGLPLAFGLVVFCFSGHAIVPSIYTSMKEPHKFESMVTVTFTIVVSCCLAVGVAGYYMFGDTVADQVTLSLEQHSKAKTAMTALTWLMVLTAFSKVTLTMFPLALGFEEIFTPFLSTEGMVVFVSGCIKLVLTAMALFVSIYVPSFNYLCALVGIVCTMTVSVIFPAMAHLKLFGESLPLHEVLLDYVLVAVGLAMAIYGTIIAAL